MMIKEGGHMKNLTTEQIMNDLRPITGAERLKFFHDHRNDKDEGRCLMYPFGVTTMTTEYVKGIGNIQPNRLMCTLAHGHAPADRRYYAVNTTMHCKSENCIHPTHLKWATGPERAVLVKQLAEAAFEARIED